MPDLLFSQNAWNEFLSYKDDKKTFKKIVKLLNDIKRGGKEGKPELLSGDLAGKWSRRIDEKNRIVYRQNGDVFEIFQCRGHYSDK